MNFELTDDRRLFLNTVRRFLESEASIAHTRALHAGGGSFDPDVWRRSAELGWTSLLVAEAKGGGSISESGILDAVLVAEEMGRSVAPGPLLTVNVVAQALSLDGASDLHADVLANLLSGTAIAAWAVDEGTGTWDTRAVTMRAERQGEVWVLNGTKAFVVDAPSADWFLVTARAPDGLTQFLVRTDSAGLTIQARTSLDLVRQVGDLTFDNVRVNPATVLGQVGGAEGAVERQLRTALVLQQAETVGALDRVLEFTLAYASQRMAFGRPIASYQVIKHRFADMRMWLEACHATAQASAAAVAAGSSNAGELVSVAASYIAERAPLMVQDCVQIHGGIGVTWEHDLHLYLRRVTQNAHLFGGVREHRDRLANVIGMGVTA